MQIQTVSAQFVSIHFSHYCNNTILEPNKTLYTNALGTKFQINQLQYFISNITLYSQGKSITINNIYYIDIEWNTTIQIPIQDITQASISIDSVSFTFGIPNNQNHSYMFTQAPENRMFWPEQLGGGYHYMKMNIKYIDNQDSISLFNCHLGKGQIIKDDTMSFIDNSFRVTLTHSFTINPKRNSNLDIRMNIEKWFQTPYTIDFNEYQGIMQNQIVMQQICTNGLHVFE